MKCYLIAPGFFLLFCSILISLYKKRVATLKQMKYNDIPEDNTINLDDKIERVTYKNKILREGYNFEQHKIRTADDYILTAWRITSRANETTTDKKPAFILNHGLLDASYTFLALNKSHSLPFLLVNKGYLNAF